MQNNAVFQHPWVLTYCLGKSPDSKLGCNISSADARNNAKVVQVYDRTIIPHTAIGKGYVSKIGTPDFVRRINSKVLLDQILKYLMSRSFSVPGLMSSGHRKQSELCVHVLMTGSCADADFLAFQKNSHKSVTGNSFTLVVGFGYYRNDLRLVPAIL